VEINVKYAKSLQVCANSGGPIKKTWGAIKKKLETIKQKNEVEATSPNKKAKIQKKVRDLTLIFIVPLVKIYSYYEE
jgi:hypothetical protein